VREPEKISNFEKGFKLFAGLRGEGSLTFRTAPESVSPTESVNIIVTAGILCRFAENT
jgi:hypothetical protein